MHDVLCTAVVLLYRELRRRRSSYENHPLSGWFRKGFCRWAIPPQRWLPCAKGAVAAGDWGIVSVMWILQSLRLALLGTSLYTREAKSSGCRICDCSANLQMSDFFRGLSALPAPCPYRAEQATGLAGGYDYTQGGRGSLWFCIGRRRCRPERYIKRKVTWGYFCWWSGQWLLHLCRGKPALRENQHNAVNYCIQKDIIC